MKALIEIECEREGWVAVTENENGSKDGGDNAATEPEKEDVGLGVCENGDRTGGVVVAIVEARLRRMQFCVRLMESYGETTSRS